MKKILCFIFSFLLVFCSCNAPEAENPTSSQQDSASVPQIQSETPSATVDRSVFGVAYVASRSCDPYSSSNELNSELVRLICEPLFSLSEDFLAQPCLCSEYSYSDKTYTLTIKSGVTFSDGSALTANDVKYSFDCAMEPSSYYATRLSVIESVSSSNKSGTVTIKLKYDNARFPALLDFPIVKKDTRANVFPTGTGIYAPDEDFSSLVARGDHHSGKTPPYKTIRLYDVANADEQVFEFDNHNVSLISTDPSINAPLRPTISFTSKSIPTTRMHYLGFNSANPLLSDPAVRLAISRAIDRESAAAVDFSTMARPAELPIHPTIESYPAEAAKSLAFSTDVSLSITEPLTILVNSENSRKIAVCNRIAEALTKLGAPTTVRSLPFEEYSAALQAGDFTLYYAEVALGADFDITRLISGSLNFGGTVFETLNAANTLYLAGDEAKDEFLSAFCNTVPFAPIMFCDISIYTQENLFTNYSPTAQNVYNNFCDWVVGG